MSELENLKKRLAQLESENNQLRQSRGGSVEFKAREDSYQGRPILTFEGPVLIKPFSLGLKKLQTIQACWHTVERFIKQHTSSTPQSPIGQGIDESDTI